MKTLYESLLNTFEDLSAPLKGAPKKVGIEFAYAGCKGEFTIADMKAVTKASQYSTIV